MALRAIYKSETGDVDAYFRINEVYSHYEKNYGDASAVKNVKCSVQALTWGSREILADDCWVENFCGPHSFTVAANVDWDSLIDKAYEHLKTLDKFSSATDCQTGFHS